MRSFAALAAVAALSTSLLAACSKGTPTVYGGTPGVDGSDGAGVLAAVSGSRLRAKVLVTADGARQFTGWFDSMRKEDCAFALAGDNTLRCLPLSPGANASGVYSDAACSKALAPVTTIPSCAEVTSVLESTYMPGGMCGAGAQIRNVRAVTKVTTATTYAQINGCTETLTPSPVAYYQLGDLIAPESFVQGTAQTDPGDGLVAKYIVAADGAREHVGWQIGRLAVDCAFQKMADGVARCSPQGSGGEPVFSTPTCTSAVTAVRNVNVGGTCDTATSHFFLQSDPSGGSCSAVSGVFSIGDTIPTPGVTYDGYGTQCSMTDTRNESIRTVSDMTTTLPSTPRLGSGSGSLVPALVFVSPNSLELVPGWHDVVHDVDCQFAIAADGKTRCLPANATATTLFTDKACKGTRVAALTGTTCDVVTPKFATEASTTLCPGPSHVYSLGDLQANLMSGSVSTNGQCALLAGAQNVYPATEVDPSQFEEATVITE